MLKNSGYSSQRLLILFTSCFVILLIVTAFISYSGELGREARINMLKVTQVQLQSTNRMLLSRSTILNVQAEAALDATHLDAEYVGGQLSYGELRAKAVNIPIFVNVNQLILEEDIKQGTLRFYPQGMQGKSCFLTYLAPSMVVNEQGEWQRQAAQYVINDEQC